MTPKLDSVELVDLSSDTTDVDVGTQFSLLVRIATPQSSEVVVLLEKQRIVQASGGEPLLRPTGAKYFQVAPQPIRIAANSTTASSDPIVVAKGASAPTGDPPVRFPEHLLFTATIGGQPLRNGRFCVVRVHGID
jgi:hypothetical protein